MTFGKTVKEPKTTADRRSTLLKQIENVPGIRYRELLRLTELPNGVLFHHLANLEEAGLIQVHRKYGKKTTRYYPINISERESAILSCIRHKPLRQIMLLLLDQDVCTLNDLVSFTHKAPSTLFAHLKHLKGAGLISAERKELCFLYSLVDRELVAEIMSKYKMSFADKAIDHFLEMVDEL